MGVGIFRLEWMCDENYKRTELCRCSTESNLSLNTLYIPVRYVECKYRQDSTLLRLYI
jgi:hypothetical protein